MNPDLSKASVVASKCELASERTGGDCRHLAADHPGKHEPPWSEMYRIGKRAWVYVARTTRLQLRSAYKMLA